jgi:hypothetical protein
MKKFRLIGKWIGQWMVAALAAAGVALLFSNCLAMTDSGAFWENNPKYNPEILYEFMKDKQVRTLIGTADDPVFTDVRRTYSANAQKYLAALNPDFKYVVEPNPTMNWLWTNQYGNLGDPDYVAACDFSKDSFDPLVAQYQRLETLAAAYAIEGQPLYLDSTIYNIIVKGLPIIMAQGKFTVFSNYFAEANVEPNKLNIYPGLTSRRNWYEWHITFPRSVGNILVLMLDYLSPEIIAEWAGYAHKWSSDYRSGANYANNSGQYVNWGMDGANNADFQTTEIALAIAAAFGPAGADGKEGKRTAHQWLSDAKAKLELDDVMYPASRKAAWNTGGNASNGLNNGPYEDGSYIYHGEQAYIGSYGGVAITNLGKISVGPIFNTPYALNNSKFTVFFDWISDGIVPLLWGGKMMNIVNGRSVVRTTSHGKGIEYDNGRTNMAEVAKIIDTFGTAEQKRRIFGPLKYNVRTGYDYFDNYATTTSAERGRYLTNLLNGSLGGKDIKPQKYTGMKAYNAMDKAVQHINHYAVALGLSSTRIAAYEWTSFENMHGWFQGDGTMWLYNYDWGQFTQNYPVTVDPFHLPGVTNNLTQPPPYPAGASGTRTIMGGSAHAGSATDGITGVAAMALDKAGVNYESKLKAKKSWFLLDGAIVSLGAGITDTETSKEVHTTVENRELTAGIGQEAKLKGGAVSGAKTEAVIPEVTVAKGDWAHLAGIRGQATTAIGYVFLDNANVNARKEPRDEKLDAIYVTAGTENIRYQASYFKMYINHGTGTGSTPASYAYVTLPGKSDSETAAYAASIDSHITVLKNTADIQAIQAGDIIAMSVFKSSGDSVTVGTETYSVDKASLVQIKKLENNIYSISMSYPLHAAGTVTLTLPFTASLVSRVADAAVNVNGNKVTITSNNIGPSYTVEVARN